MEEQKGLFQLRTVLRIKKIIKKSAAKAFKGLKEGDTIVIKFDPFLRLWHVYKVTPSGELLWGEVSESVLGRLIGGSKPTYELEHLNENAGEEINEYCKTMCLINSPESCEVCPLNKYKS